MILNSITLALNRSYQEYEYKHLQSKLDQIYRRGNKIISLLYNIIQFVLIFMFKLRLTSRKLNERFPVVRLG